MNAKASLLLALTMLVLLTGCAASQTPVLEDGSAVYSIECGPTVRGLSECFQRAGKTCGAEGFSVIRSDGTVAATSSAGSFQSQATLVQSAMDNNTMMIKCGT